MITFILLLIGLFLRCGFIFFDSAMIGLLMFVLIIANGLVERLLFLEIVFSQLVLFIETRLLIPRFFELFIVLISSSAVKILPCQHFS
jgi:hypothetical protein